MATNYTHIGKKLKQIRLNQELTQEQLGERAQLHYSYIGQVERGDKTPSLKALTKIATALNTNVETILEEKEEYIARTNNDCFQELIKIVENRPPEDVQLLCKVARALFERIDKFKRFK